MRCTDPSTIEVDIGFNYGRETDTESKTNRTKEAA